MIDRKKQKLGYLEGWLSAALNIFLFALQLWAGIVIGSVAMTASAWHTLSDTLTSAIVLAGFYIAGNVKSETAPGKKVMPDVTSVMNFHAGILRTFP